MKFITISQYFNKLQSTLFVLLMVPLLAFIALYFFVKESHPDPPGVYLILLLPLALLDWFMALAIFDKRIKSARREQGLGAKLDKYFDITIVRYSILSAGSLLLALGWYLTGSNIFTTGYLAGLVMSGVIWPRAVKVCRDLKLKGDEHEMVFFKKDTFK